jgi:hypothetical protein
VINRRKSIKEGKNRIHSCTIHIHLNEFTARGIKPEEKRYGSKYIGRKLGPKMIDGKQNLKEENLARKR